jgi:hypothetical protein
MVTQVSGPVNPVMAGADMMTMVMTIVAGDTEPRISDKSLWFIESVL